MDTETFTVCLFLWREEDLDTRTKVNTQLYRNKQGEMYIHETRVTQRMETPNQSQKEDNKNMKKTYSNSI